MNLDERLFEIANTISAYHTKRGWFESVASALTRHIRLRSDIYSVLVAESRRSHHRGSDE